MPRRLPRTALGLREALHSGYDGDDDYFISCCTGIVPCKSGYSASSYGVSSVGGTTHQSVLDLTQCQLICSLSVSCLGLDFDASSTPYVHCVTHDHTTFNTRRTTDQSPPSTVQYTKIDACATSTCIVRLHYYCPR